MSMQTLEQLSTDLLEYISVVLFVYTKYSVGYDFFFGKWMAAIIKEYKPLQVLLYNHNLYFNAGLIGQTTSVWKF